MSNNERLWRLIDKHKLRRNDVAELSGYTRSSVDRWLRPTDNERYMDMPNRAMELLELKLSAMDALGQSVPRKRAPKKRRRRKLSV